VQVLEEENIDLMQENKDLRLEISRLRIAHDMAAAAAAAAVAAGSGASGSGANPKPNPASSSSSTIAATHTQLPPLPPTPSPSSENEVSGFAATSMSKPCVVHGVTASGTKRAFGTELDGNALPANTSNGNSDNTDAAPGSVLKKLNSFDAAAATTAPGSAVTAASAAASSRRSKVKVNTAGTAAAQPATGAVGSGDGAQECNQS
jgi:hypothetical protein